VGLRSYEAGKIKVLCVQNADTCTIRAEAASASEPEPVAVPIYGDMRPYLETQPRTSEFLFARGSMPIRDSG
jgi:hypothetical protein